MLFYVINCLIIIFRSTQFKKFPLPSLTYPIFVWFLRPFKRINSSRMNPLHFDPLSILALTRWPGDFGSFRIDANETYSPRNQANSLKNQRIKKMFEYPYFLAAMFNHQWKSRKYPNFFQRWFQPEARSAVNVGPEAHLQLRAHRMTTQSQRACLAATGETTLW